MHLLFFDFYILFLIFYYICKLFFIVGFLIWGVSNILKGIQYRKAGKYLFSEIKYTKALILLFISYYIMYS